MNDFDIACFMSAARLCNFSAAAKEFSIPQQMVSRNIKQLETELAAQLFLRRGQQLTLTRTGKALFELFSELDEGLSWGRAQFSDSERDRFSLAFLELCPLPEPLYAALDALRAKHPQTELSAVFAVSAGELAAALESHRATLAVAPEPLAAECALRPGLRVTPPFAKEPLFLIAAEECFENASPKPETLAALPCLFADIGPALESRLAKAGAELFAGWGLPFGKTERCPNQLSVYTQCLCKNGYTISPVNSALRLDGGLCAFPLGCSLPVSAVCLCSPGPPLRDELMDALGG